MSKCGLNVKQKNDIKHNLLFTTRFSIKSIKTVDFYDKKGLKIKKKQ